MSSCEWFKNINELCVGRFEFFIPSYQRGYRWTDQVTKLLNDLLEFSGKNAIYCLQPIIVKRRDAAGLCYEIVDGQQRLTTIFLILKLLRKDDMLFSLSYARREPNSIDKYHIRLAKNNIKEWFQQQPKDTPNGTILSKTKIEHILTNNVTLIWYELSPEITDDECRRIFHNINAGKIPLTVSEITKAMLLNEKLYEHAKGEQLYRASVWDEMLHTLDNDAFWEFISEDKFSTPTRTDYILTLKWCTKNGKNKPPEHPGEIFNFFEGWLGKDSGSSKENAKETFDALRKYFRIFQDWYSNPEYCNYIGYLVRYKAHGLKKLIVIIDRYENDSHSEFMAWLKSEVKEAVNLSNIEELLELSYTEDKDKTKLQDILLLFSIITANKIGERFNFNPAGGWSLEHIFAKNSDIIKKDERVSWLRKYLDSNIIEVASRSADDEKHREKLQELRDAIVDFIEKDTASDDTPFKELFEKIGNFVEHYNILNIHSIANLTLLGKNDNSSLNKLPFYEKRRKIISMSSSGKSSIPQAALNVFQKVYSTLSSGKDDNSVYRGNLDIWSKQDSEAYLQNIKSELRDFITEGENHE